MKRHTARNTASPTQVLLFLFFAASALPIPGMIHADAPSVEFYAFSNNKCPPCVETMSQLRTDFPKASFVVHEMENNSRYFQRIVACLNESLGREVVPSLPMLGVFVDGHLRAVSGGPLGPDKWETLMSRPSGEVRVYFELLGGNPYVNETIRKSEAIVLLEGLFKKTVSDTGDGEIDVPSLLVPLVVAAAVDAVNPCAFNTFLIFLAYALHNIGRQQVLKVGLSFSLAVFLVYLLLGLGLFRFLGQIPYAQYGVAIFAAVMGFMRIAQFLGVKVKYVPSGLGDRLSERLQSILSPKGGFVAGVLTASLILPCSSAPYFIVLDLLSRNVAPLAGILLLGLYNTIIILPFLVMSLGVYALSASTMDVRLWTKTNERWVNLAMGVALVGLSLFVLI